MAFHRNHSIGFPAAYSGEYDVQIFSSQHEYIRKKSCWLFSFRMLQTRIDGENMKFVVVFGLLFFSSVFIKKRSHLCAHTHQIKLTTIKMLTFRFQRTNYYLWFGSNRQWLLDYDCCVCTYSLHAIYHFSKLMRSRWETTCSITW